MLPYYFVILWVIIFGGLADQMDANLLPTDLDINNFEKTKKICHTPNAKHAFLAVSIILTLTAALRYRVGTDYGGYYVNWEMYAEDFINSAIHLDEPGYRLICALFKAIGIRDGAFPVFTAATITIGLSLFIVYRNTDKLGLASILFLFIYWVASFNAVRQCLATTFVFCGYNALRNKRLREYAIWVGIGFLFHRSAICMIFPFFFIHNKLSIINMILLLIGCIIFLQSYDLAFDFTGAILDKEFNMETLDSYNLNKVNRLRVLANCAPAAFFFGQALLQKKIVSYNQNFYINILLFKAAISIAAMNSPYLSRMGIYFSPLLIMALCGLINEIPKDKRKFFVFCMCFFYGYFFLYEIKHSSALRYFQFIWQR